MSEYVFPFEKLDVWQYEVVTLNEVFRRKKLFKEEDALNVRNRCVQIDRKLIGLINSLRGKKRE